jgi:hypothetical protein
MSLPHNLMKNLAEAGANLIIENEIPHDLLHELITIAKSSGASIMLMDSYPHEELEKAASTGGNILTIKCSL